LPRLCGARNQIRASLRRAHLPASKSSATPSEQTHVGCSDSVAVQPFSSRNRRDVPRRVPHLRLSAHRRPPIAPALPPPGRQVARGGGAARSLQPFVEILPNDFAVPSNCIPQFITGTLSSSSHPGHLLFTTSH